MHRLANYGHDVEHIDLHDDLRKGDPDRRLARYSLETERIIVSYDSICSVYPIFITKWAVTPAMSERDSGVPEGRCGFELRPEDLGSERDLDDSHKLTEAVSCWRETWRNGRCLWHADTDEKPVKKLVAEARNEPDRRLDGAIFRDVKLNQRVSFAGFTLIGARFENVDLSGTNFRGASLRGAEFPNSSLQGAEFPDADLFKAGFPDADLRNANFNGTHLQGAVITDSDLRRATIKQVTVSQATQFGRQTRAEGDADSISDWDEISQVHHTLRNLFSEDYGLVGKARKHYIWERKARGKEALADGDWPGYYGSLVSRYVTGYGVDYLRVLGVMLLAFVIPTLWYWFAPGIERSLYYSIVTFVTAPPEAPDGLATLSVSGIQAVLGTLLVVLLGYVLGNRESI